MKTTITYMRARGDRLERVGEEHFDSRAKAARALAVVPKGSTIIRDGRNYTVTLKTRG